MDARGRRRLGDALPGRLLPPVAGCRGRRSPARLGLLVALLGLLSNCLFLLRPCLDPCLGSIDLAQEGLLPSAQ